MPSYPTIGKMIKSREALCEQEWRLECGTRGNSECQVFRHCLSQ
jgi:hypothetical protein